MTNRTTRMASAALAMARATVPDRAWLKDTRGNVIMITALSLIPLTAATGMAIDYSRAARLQTKMNSAADAGALAAVTSPMMSETRQTAAEAAARMFTKQVNALAGMTWPVAVKSSPTVTTTLNSYKLDYGPYQILVTDTNLTGLNRTATVTYAANSANAFSGVLGLELSPIGGTSTTSAKTAPNIDFYVLLDTSGSMALPATSAGLKLLTSKTGGCAFACHSTNDQTATAADGKTKDFYGVARSYNISLRIDEAKTAIQNMMTQATKTSAANDADYRASLSTFAAADSKANNSFETTQTITAKLSDVADASKLANTSLYYKNSCPTSSYCNNDQDTATDDAFSRMASLMPSVSGNGSNLPLDTPQSMMFVITDGMRDENRPGGKPEAAIDQTWCNTIKGRGIRIAILYTEYLPESLSDDWSKNNVLPNLPKVEPALQSCASPGLYYKVTTDGDITAALNQLFQQAVATAHITN